MQDSYSKASLLKFLDTLADKGLANTNTANSYKVSANKILGDLAPDEEADVRRVDVETAVRRFNNRNPGLLSPKSLAEYQRRVTAVIKEFVRYTENPAGYKTAGKAVPIKKTDSSAKAKERAKPVEGRPAPPAAPQPFSPPPSIGLSLSYPLRPDFLAQIVIPRDMKTDEAKRLSAFVMTLATDFAPA